MSSALIWDVDREVYLFGFLWIRWYSLFFVTGVLLCSLLFKKLLSDAGRAVPPLSMILNYGLIIPLICGRLVHCFFYMPHYYLADPVRILQIWNGGLASHGSYLGVFVSCWVYAKRHDDVTFLWVLDRVFVCIPLICSLIRLGNFFNSEIIGIPTDVPWAVIWLIRQVRTSFRAGHRF